VPPKKEYLHQLGGFGIRPYMLQNKQLCLQKRIVSIKRADLESAPTFTKTETIVAYKRGYLHKKGGFGTRPYILQIK
jgi:hypothetical protein